MSPLGNANDRGAWAVGTAYALNDVVTYENRKFVCVNASGSTGNDPSGDSANTYWQEFAVTGADADEQGGFAALSTAKRIVPLNETTYTANDGDVIIATVTTAITSPPSVEGAYFEVISNGASITATVTPATGTVNGASTVTVTTQYTKKTFRCDGTNWFAS